MKHISTTIPSTLLKKSNIKNRSILSPCHSIRVFSFDCFFHALLEARAILPRFCFHTYIPFLFISVFFFHSTLWSFFFFLHLRLLPFLGPASFFPVCVWVISIRFEALFLFCFAFIVFCLILTALLGTRPFSSCCCSLSAAAYYFWMYILLFYFGKEVKEKTLWDFFCCVYICLCKWDCGCLTSCSLLPLTLKSHVSFSQGSWLCGSIRFPF